MRRALSGGLAGPESAITLVTSFFKCHLSANLIPWWMIDAEPRWMLCILVEHDQDDTTGFKSE